MSDIQILTGRLDRDLLVTMPGMMEGHLKLSVPEFYGKTDGTPFAIEQVLAWETGDAGDVAAFGLDTLPSDIGIDYYGDARIDGPDEVLLEMSVSNVFDTEISDAHHTVHLDLTTTPGFQDDTGERTFAYTNRGWVNLPDLLGDRMATAPSIWTGATYGETTAIWRVLARVDVTGQLVAALALDRGFVFSSNHPDWPSGLLVGCKWGTLRPNETQEARGKVYLFHGSLENLRERYNRDFRP